MTDLKILRADARGFSGRFFYDAERGDIAWIAEDCEKKQCDCERKVNADGDQDCSLSLLDDTGEVDDICEPIARMLNAVGPLLDEVEILREERQLHVVAMAERDALRRDMGDSLRRELEEVRAANERLYIILKGTFAAHLMTPELAAEADALRKAGGNA